MNHKLLKKCLYLAPIAVLGVMLFLLNHTLHHFKATAYQFVYETNTEALQMFWRELNALGSQGYPSQTDEYQGIYTHVIHNYNTIMGEKEAIITFMMGEEGHIYHSTDDNKAYLDGVLNNAENMELIADAWESKSNGEVVLRRGNQEETMYYHWFYSWEDDYTLFMTVNADVIEKQLNVNAIILPISAIGLLLLVMMEYLIWHKLEDNQYDELRVREKAREAEASDGD